MSLINSDLYTCSANGQVQVIYTPVIVPLPDLNDHRDFQPRLTLQLLG